MRGRKGEGRVKEKKGGDGKKAGGKKEQEKSVSHKVPGP
jgi:hypothetical protein